MATGLEQVVTGVQLVKNSFDAVKVQAVAKELKEGCTKLAELAQLGITEMKENKQT